MLDDLASIAEAELTSVEVAEALARVKLNEARLGAISSAVDEAILVVDGNGDIVDANPAAHEMFGSMPGAGIIGVPVDCSGRAPACGTRPGRLRPAAPPSGG